MYRADVDAFFGLATDARVVRIRDVIVCAQGVPTGAGGAYLSHPQSTLRCSSAASGKTVVLQNLPDRSSAHHLPRTPGKRRSRALRQSASPAVGRQRDLLRVTPNSRTDKMPELAALLIRHAGERLGGLKGGSADCDARGNRRVAAPTGRALRKWRHRDGWRLCTSSVPPLVHLRRWLRRGAWGICYSQVLLAEVPVPAPTAPETTKPPRLRGFR
jgi:hypothetical protein